MHGAYRRTFIAYRGCAKTWTRPVLCNCEGTARGLIGGLTLPSKQYPLLGNSTKATKTEITKATRARYRLEFKQEAVPLVGRGRSVAAAASTLGPMDQTLFNGVKAHRQGKLEGVDSKPVSAEQTEIDWLQPSWRA